ncbi:MAG: hypothetical protein JW927_18190 [Deltaproteobacteria bacterium]|nr:hypothetical protein [Deltaproteobacteria bacterium]
MRCTKIKFSLLLIVLMAMVFTMACKTKNSGEFKPKLYYTIDGVVKNIAGDPLEKVRVEVAGYTMTNSSDSKPTDQFATLTDADGAFSLEVIAYDKVDLISLKISKDGYSPNFMNVGVIEGETVETSGVLQLTSSLNAIDATVDNTITNGGASVTISANTLVNAAGATVSTAQVSVTAIDTTGDLSLLPGDLYGFDNGSLKLFTTFGMIDITVEDVEGDPLNLRSGATASISIPLGDNVGDNPSPTVGLWYYDQEAAKWLLQGSLTLNNAGTAYEGTISHFSIYNAGKTFEGVTYFKIRVIDQSDLQVYGASVSFFQPTSFSNDGVWNANYTTGPEGYVPSVLDTTLSGVVPSDRAGYIPLPADTDLNIRVKYIKNGADDNANNDEVFTFPDLHATKGKQYEFYVDGVNTTPATPYTIRTGAAGAMTSFVGPAPDPSEIEEFDPEDFTPFSSVKFNLETSTYITATVKWDDGTPASGAWLYRDIEGTRTYYYVGTDGIATVYFSFPAITAHDFPSETDNILMRVTGGPWAAKYPVKSWFVSGDGYTGTEVLPFAVIDGTEDKDTVVFSTGPKGSNVHHEITLIKSEKAVPYTYISGVATLANGSLAPQGSWVIFSCTVGGVPVVIRAQVAADGTYPDPEGGFEFETIDGENYVAIPAETDISVSIFDFETDPSNPEELFTYDFKSGKENLIDDVVITADAYIQLTVNDENGDPLSDLMVTFEETNPKEDPDGEDGELLEPDIVQAYTNAQGIAMYTPFGKTAQSNVPLMFDTQYTVTVSEYETIKVNNVDTKVATNVIYTFMYKSLTDGDIDEVIYPPQPPSVSGTVYYSNGTTPASGYFVHFVPPGGQQWVTSKIGLTNASGVYAEWAAGALTGNAAITLDAGVVYTVIIASPSYANVYTGSYTAGASGSGQATLNITMTGVAAP